MAFYIYRRFWRSATGRGTAFVVESRTNGVIQRRQFSTKTEAYKYAAAHETPSLRYESLHTSFKAIADMYLTDAEFNGLDVSTLNQYRSHISAHLVPAFSDIQLQHLHRDVIVQKVSALRERLSPAQAQNIFQTMRRIFRFAVTRCHLKEDPSSGLRGGSLRKIRFMREGNAETLKRKHRFLTKSELGILVNALGGVGPNGPLPLTNVIAFLNIALFAGLRASETRGLIAADLSLEVEPATVSVRRRADHQQILGPTKTSSSVRVVPIPARLASLLRHWISRKNLGANDLLLSTQGRPLNPNNFYNRDFVRFMNGIGLVRDASAIGEDAASSQNGTPKKEHTVMQKPAFTIHSLRHTFASIQIQIGLDPKRIQTRMGHSNILHTLNFYGHLWRDPARDLEEMTEISKKIDEISAAATGSDVTFLPTDES